VTGLMTMSALQAILKVDDQHPLADRELRNSWMHFDERLDAAIVGKTYGDRHRFVQSSKASEFVGKTLRLMEIDTLMVRYRKQDGTQGSADLRATRGELERLWHASENPLAG
jgi:hypothetical protein